MDNLTTEQGNALIMFFDGAERTEFNLLGKPAKAVLYHGSYFPEDRPPAFNKDWNLLKPIIEKIYDWYNNDSDDLADEFEKAELQLFNLTIFAGIKETWRGVIAFIQWYNTQNSTK